MIRYLIIPDVHGRTFWKESVYDYLENHPEVKIIFLGDYLDPYQYEGIYPEDAIPVFEEIISLKKQYPDRIILLIGNHDLHYVQNHRRGCRMDYMNKDKIVGLFDDNKDLFTCCLCDVIGGKNVIFSHAGFTKSWLNWHINIFHEDWYDKYTDEEIYENIDFEFIKGINWDETIRTSGIFGDVSSYRGGGDQFSSFLWTDLEEMITSGDFINAIQIFGHSQQESDPVNYKDFLYCLDCRQSFIIGDDAKVRYLDGSELTENGTALEEKYHERAKQMLKYAGFFL